MRTISGRTRVAAVVGRPVTHSVSPILHNAWLEAAGIDGVYVAIEVGEADFPALIDGLRATSVTGLNVTAPHKEAALAAAHDAHPRARRAGAANLLTFGQDGQVRADNTDGLGLLQAFAEQAPQFRAAQGPVVVLGAGGAARGAVGALADAGRRDIRIVNRTVGRAEALAKAIAGSAFGLSELEAALHGAVAVVNATSAGTGGGNALDIPLSATPPDCVVMDMVYRPLETPLLRQARALGRPTVDGLAMLIGQAKPSFEALFGQPPPAGVDVRGLAVEALGL